MLSKLRPTFRRRPPQLDAPPPAVNEADEDGHGARMGFFEHLEELRNRVFKALIILVLGTVLGVVVAAPALEYLMQPYCSTTDDCRLVSLGPTGGVVAYFRVSLMIGAIIAVPVITYQLLMFIFPGLTRKERRLVLLSLPAIMGLFLLGVAFSWFVLMPPALGFLEGFQPTLFKPEWTAELYLSFITALIFWMGVAFETPLVFFVLAVLGLVSARALLRNWRIAVVGAAVAAALITPTVDPVNMALVIVPLLVLYLFSIFLVVIGRRISKLA